MVAYSYTADTYISFPEAGKYSTYWKATPSRGASKYPCVATHGSGAQWGFIDGSRAGSNLNLPMLATGGINCVSGEMAGQAWGSDAAMTQIDAHFAKIKTYYGLTSSKMHLFGGSMGAFTAMRYATLNPSKVASMTLLIPLCNLTNFWNANAGSVANEISAAWGVANGTPPPAGADIRAGLAAIAGQFPVNIYYSSADAIVSVPDIISTAALVGATVLKDVGPNGHSEQTVLDYIAATNNMQDTINLMIANGA